MMLKFTILGCGSSGGVPRPALGWGACDPNNPKNRRRRTSLLVERRDGGGITRVLVDTSPDLREQMLDAEADSLDAVLYTHEHADHTHGVDDLRAFYIKQRRPIDVYLDDYTSKSMHTRFDYCFRAPPGSEYPPLVREHRLAAGAPVTVAGKGGPLTALSNITTGVGSFITFSEISLNFKVGPVIMISGILFALFMGAIGGLFPARMAAKKEILTALREV